MFDMRLYTPSGIFLDGKFVSEKMNDVLPDDPKSSSYEVIAGKVVKFLLTEKGSDAFNPSYGGISMHHRQISQAYLPQLRIELNADIEACTKFIKEYEIRRNITGERLYKIDVLKVVYNQRLTPMRLDVYLDIYTTVGNHAVVAITGPNNARV